MAKGLARALFTSALLIGICLAANAAPTSFNYQGRLNDSQGSPITGTKAMAFEFYDAAAGGTLLGGFSESQNVAVTDGIFNVLIGSGTVGGIPTGIFDQPAVYLCIKVEGEELSPRTQVVAVPYAFRTEEAEHAASADQATQATNADQLDGKNSSEFAISSHTHTLGSIATPIEILNVVKTVDGVGSGLDADLLDGKDSRDYAAAAHNHDAAYVNIDGDTMAGALKIEKNLDVLGATTLDGDLAVGQNATVDGDAVVGSLSTPGSIAAATDKIGGITSGVVDQTVYNGDVAAANSVRADRGIYGGSSLTDGTLGIRNIAGNNTLYFDGGTAGMYLGSYSAPGVLRINNSSNIETITLAGSNGMGNFDGKVTAGKGLAGTGVSGTNYSPPLSPVDPVPGVRGTGTSGGLLNPGAVGIEAIGGGGTLLGSSDIAFRSRGSLQFLTHDSKGVYLSPGDGDADSPLTVGRFGSTSAYQPLVRFNGGIDVAGDIAVPAGLSLLLSTSSGSRWSFTGKDSAGSSDMQVQGPSYGEMLFDWSNANIKLGGSSADTVRIPAIIQDGINVKRDASGGVSSATVRAENINASGIALYGVVESTDASAVVVNKGTGDILRGFSGATGGNLVFRVLNSGRVVCSELQITGGADLAEPFDVADTKAIEAGMVVAIDPENAGGLRLTSTPYDRTVAGIVSGANGIKPGLTMKQNGTAANGSLPVALTGRVYCWCNASNGAIQPGDMLTTSAVSGEAMKVTDYERARGAVIGKAMTSLKSGRGLVLVLVTLQ